MFRPSILVSQQARHRESRFSVCAESRFGRCAAGDDRKGGAITPTAAAWSRFRHSAEADRVVPENTGQSVGRVDYPDVRTGLAGVPVACWGKPEEIRFQCTEGQITRGVPPEAMLDGVRRYARYPGGYRGNGNGICSASDDVFGPDRNFENPPLLPGKRHEQPALCESYFWTG